MAGGGEAAIPEEWKNLVRSLGSEQLVDAIYVAIHDLAARDTIPHEVLRRMAAVREQVALIDENTSVGEEEVASIKTKLGEVVGQEDGGGNPSSGSSESEAAVVELLRALLAVPMTLETLEKTKIGKTITGLTKHSSEQVRGLAGELYKNWRALVNEHLTTRSKPTTKTASVPLVVADHTKANTAAAHKHKVAPAPTKTTASALAAAAHRAVQATAAMKKTSSNNKRKEAPAMMPEMEDVKLEAATKKLREGYREAETAKKQRKIQMINAPPGKVKPRFVVVERVVGMARCAPVASSLRM